MSMWPNIQLGFLSSGGLHCWLINEPRALLGGLGLAFYKEHIVLFQPVLPHPGSELSVVFFLDSLFFEKSIV